MSKALLEKLERYEEEAYDGGFGQDWMESIGEGFKFYLADCQKNKKRATIAGFERYIDSLHEKALKEG